MTGTGDKVDDLVGKEETALQLFARLRVGPSLDSLEPNLFRGGLRSHEVVEICGEHSTGKTLLIMQLIRNAILPASLGGQDSSVILLNTDQHFSVVRLHLLIECYISDYFRSRTDQADGVAKESMKNLKIINCFDSDSLLMSFNAVKRMVCEDGRIVLIVIDSICAFYWVESLRGGIRKMDLYVVTLIRALCRCVNSFKVSVVFTRPKYFQTAAKPSASLSPVYDLRNINTSVNLEKQVANETTQYRAEVRRVSSIEVKYYTIAKHGITWL